MHVWFVVCPGYSLRQHFVAGMVAGVCACPLTVPVERVKCVMQVCHAVCHVVCHAGMSHSLSCCEYVTQFVMLCVM